MEQASPFDELMTDYKQDVFNYSYYLIGKQEFAEEITQEVFLRAFRSMHSFRGDSSPKSWLFTIARNVAQDFKRKYLDRRVMPMEHIRTSEYSPSAESEYFQFKYKGEICEKMLELPQAFRDVMLMDIKYDRSIEEIANSLHLSVGTVKSRLHRARNKMSKLIKQGVQQHEICYR